jgi:sugar lactone lactonase YvrE/5-hydroxyisourate hydrolase-like protein (transthyretin family)
MWRKRIAEADRLLSGHIRSLAFIALALVLAAGSMISLGIVQAHPRSPATGPTISLSSHRGPAGGSFTVTGSNFGANDSITISWIEQANNQQTQLGTATANSLGQFRVTVTTPANASYGVYTVQAAGQPSGDKATSTYNIGANTGCDNTDTCGTAVGNWTPETSPPGYIGPNYYIAQGNGSDTFTWMPSLPFAGTYEVYIRVIPSSSYTKAAVYTINYNGGSTTVTVNQQLGTSAYWQDVGSYSFAQGNTIVLTDATSDGLPVEADAVLLINGTVVISGSVLVNGQPAPSGIRIDLWRLAGAAPTLLQSTNTTSSGSYAFTNVPADVLYYVEYYNGWGGKYNQNYVGYWIVPSQTIASDYTEPTFDIGYNEQNNLLPANQTITLPIPTSPTQFSWNAYPGATSYTFQVVQEPKNWVPGQGYDIYYSLSDTQNKSLFQEPCTNNAQRICFSYQGLKNVDGTGLLPIGAYLWGATFTAPNGQGGVLYQPITFGPRLVVMTPTFDAAGQPIMLQGAGFDTANLSNDTVFFGTTQATITSATPPYTLNVTVPATLPSGPINVTVQVATTNDQQQQTLYLTSNPQSFNVTTGTVSFLGRKSLSIPDGLAIDSRNNLYVSNFGTGVVSKIGQNNIVSSYTSVPHSSTTGPAGLTISGTSLYAAYYAPAPNGALYVTPAGGQASVFVSGLDNPALMATDSNGNIWVADYGSDTVHGTKSRVLEYAPDGTLLLSLSITGADAVTFDSQGNVYVAAYQSGTIWTFPNVPNPTPTVYVQSPSLVGCDALAFDSAGNLWVTTYGVYNQDNGALYEITNGQLNTTPFAQNLANPAAIGFDATGAMYLVMTGQPNVWKYVP